MRSKVQNDKSFRSEQRRGESKEATPPTNQRRNQPTQNSGEYGRRQDSGSTEGNQDGKSSPGLDSARHQAAQRAAAQADALRTAVVPGFMATALSLEKLFDPEAYRLYLQQLIKDAGSPSDPIEKMLLEQLALAHFRIADLQAHGGVAKGLEAIKLLNTMAARMLGEFRRTALALQAYRSRLPASEQAKNLRLFKAAQ
jgi:hypothetical protein